MITEDYVSFEVAKLLKEKGFDTPVWTRYEDDNEVIFGDKNNWNNSPMGQISAPTHQMAIKWLREVHNVVIVIEPHTYNYINEKNSSYVFAIWEGDNYIEIYSYKNSGLRGILYPTYEEAVEASLKYCLENLI